MKHERNIVPASEAPTEGFRYPQMLFRKGDGLIIEGLWHQYLNSDRNGNLIVSMKPPFAQRTLTHADAFALYFQRKLEIQRGSFGAVQEVVAGEVNKPLAAFDKDELDGALAWLEYCHLFRRLYDAGKVPKTIKGWARVARVGAWQKRRRLARELNIPVGTVGLEQVSGYTFRFWYRRWEACGYMLAALIKMDRNKGSRARKLRPEVVRVIHDCIVDRFLTMERVPMGIVHQEICARIQLLNDHREAAHQLDEPHLSSVNRWLDGNFDDFEIYAARFGMAAAVEKYRQIKPAPVGFWPMHTIQIDYTWIDTYVVNSDGSPLRGTWEKSRPWIIAAICTLTRMIVGFYITLDPPSWTSVMHCLRHMVMPKTVDPSYGVVSAYPCVGLCEILRMDNEKAFRSRSMTLAAASLDFQIDYGPAGQSRLRGKIERFFRELNRDGMAFTPGKSFSNPTERGDYDSEGMATFTLPELIRRINVWILDVYHNRPHVGLMGMTPFQKWEATGDMKTRFADRLDDLNAILALSIQRTVQREGVRFLGLRYQSKELEKFLRRRGAAGREYILKIDPNDMSTLLFYDDIDDKWLYLPCTDLELVENVTLDEWKSVCILARRMNSGNAPSRRIMLQAKLRLNEEAATRGSRPRKSLEQVELDWYRENLDSPIWESDMESETPVQKRRKSGKTRGTVGKLDAAEAALLTSEDPIMITGPANPVDSLPAILDALGDPEGADGQRRTSYAIDHDNPDNW